MKTKFSKEVERQLLSEGKVDTYFSNGTECAYFNKGTRMNSGDWELMGAIVTEGGTFSKITLLSELEKNGFVYDESKNVRLR